MGQEKLGKKIPLRGQAAIELLAYASFFLLVFVAVVAVFFQMQSQELSRAESSFAQEVAYQFADDINTAHIAGTGFWQKVELPPNILGKNYSLTVSRRLGVLDEETGFVYVDWQGVSGRNVSLSAPTITGAYDYVRGEGVGNDSRDFILITAKSVNISNLNGTIWIKKA